MSATQYRIGHMPYINSMVFYHAMPSQMCRLISLPPRNMADAMNRGDLDAGPLPIAEVLRMKERVAPITDLGVAVSGKARSVLLFSTVPAQELTDRTVAVTAQTSTSVQLLRILFDQLWQAQRVSLTAPDAPNAHAFLLIGDDALSFAHDHQDHTAPYPFIYDLSLEWQRLTGMPFVFARWVARAEIHTHELARIIEKSYESGIANIDSISQSAHIPNMSPNDIARYIRGFTYRLAKPELDAIQEFQARLAHLPEWLPPVIPYPQPAETNPASAQ